MALIALALTACSTREPVDQYRDEVPLVYQKVFNQPRLADLHRESADIRVVREQWARGMSAMGTEAFLAVQYSSLVVTYTGNTTRRCVAANWARAFSLSLSDLEINEVRCAGGDSAPVPDDGGRAKRRRLIDRANETDVAREVGFTWPESDGLVVTAIIEPGKCNSARLKKLDAALKRAGVDLADGFDRFACSIDEAEIPLRKSKVR